MTSRLPWDQPVSSGTAKKVLELCNIGPHTDLAHFRILDFGCGNGRYLEVFASCVPRSNLYGAEISADQVARVREKGFFCLQLDPKESYLPFANESFDVVFSSNVVEHIPRRLYLEYLLEIYRVLKRGGRFVVAAPNYPIKRLYDIKKAITSDFVHYYLFDDPTHCNKMSIFRLERDLSSLFKKEVYLEPTYIFFQHRIPFLRRKRVRHLLRMLGDKVSGYCVK
jgi:SAM-dependent methyltransferase